MWERWMLGATDGRTESVTAGCSDSTALGANLKPTKMSAQRGSRMAAQHTAGSSQMR